MIEFEVPGLGTYRLQYLVLDVNGTIAVDGRLVEGIHTRLAKLRRSLDVRMLTADTRGQQGLIDAELGIRATRIVSQGEAAQKAAVVRALGAAGVCAVGNGANDAGMLDAAGLAIAVLGMEGLAAETLNASDVVVPHVNVALDLLLDPLKLVATLRR